MRVFHLWKYFQLSTVVHRSFFTPHYAQLAYFAISSFRTQLHKIWKSALQQLPNQAALLSIIPGWKCRFIFVYRMSVACIRACRIGRHPGSSFWQYLLKIHWPERMQKKLIWVLQIVFAISMIYTGILAIAGAGHGSRSSEHWGPPLAISREEEFFCHIAWAVEVVLVILLS